jgi:hypothetical protein
MTKITFIRRDTLVRKAAETKLGHVSSGGQLLRAVTLRCSPGYHMSLNPSTSAIE